MPQTADVKRYRANFQDEIDSAALYRAMAEREEKAALVEVYRRLAEAEERHAGFWEQRIVAAGGAAPERRPTLRTRILVRLAKRFGPQLVLPIVAVGEQTNQGMYDGQPETHGTGMRGQERSHARLLQTLTRASGGRGVAGSAVARLEGRHRTVGGNALRAAVLGANDGLVSNMSLVMGVAGGGLSSSAILITGFAGLLAGAISMGLGEWLSVQSSRELYQREIATEAAELEEVPEEEQEELALIYQAKGLSEDDARELAASLMADQDNALDTLVREELGIDPDELGGSAWSAAGLSFLLFSVGAIVPVLPFIFGDGTAPVVVSLVASGAALFLFGAGITLFTGRSFLFSGLRQLAFGLAAAAVTFGIGKAIGVAITG